MISAPRLSVFQRATLKNWEEPEDEATCACVIAIAGYVYYRLDRELLHTASRGYMSQCLSYFLPIITV